MKHHVQRLGLIIGLLVSGCSAETAPEDTSAEPNQSALGDDDCVESCDDEYFACMGAHPDWNAKCSCRNAQRICLRACGVRVGPPQMCPDPGAGR
jgi:hypothetical protein